MLISKDVEVRWNGFTRKWYENKGYKWTKLNDYFNCKIEDVQLNSTVKVKVKCDYCGEIFDKEYRRLFIERELISKDCCSKRDCMLKKSEETSIIKYGVENFAQTESRRKQMNLLYRTPKDEILKVCRNKNIEILNIDEYENDRTRLYIICNNHKDKGVQETNFANIKKNKKCCLYGRPELVAEARKEDGNKVYQEFVSAGLEPQFKPEDYINNSVLLPFICPIHRDKGVQYRRYGNLKYAEGCKYCANERTGSKLKLEQKKVFGDLIKKGLIPIESQVYENKDAFIYYRCINHPNEIQHTSYGNFKASKQCCDFCRAEESLTRLNRKFRSSLSNWRKDSEEQCNYKCILTGDDEYDIHHLYSYNHIIKESLNNLGLELKSNTKDYSGEEIIKIRNEIIRIHYTYPLGVCLSKDIHILFHQLYSKETTIEQFEEFKARFENHEFDNIIKVKDKQVV